MTKQQNAANLDKMMSDRMAQINTLISQIQAGVDNTMDRYREAAKAGRINWGYAGDLGHVVEELHDLATSLGQAGVK